MSQGVIAPGTRRTNRNDLQIDCSNGLLFVIFAHDS